MLCDDLDLNPMVFVMAVAQSIRHQLDTYPTENVAEEASDQRVVIKVREQGHGQADKQIMLEHEPGRLGL